MPNIQPITLYTKAINAYRDGNNEKATKLLCEALGSDEISSLVRASIKELLTDGSLANQATLQVIATEVSKRVKESKNA